ncbi:anti-sigma factor family protein [Acrocarpospora phusangensis]|nr:zf-HC2 domain-containing protein [Acrocarpospora phusangensis]
MTCDEVRLSLGVYVLGALDPEETAAVEAHLDGCPECAAEMAELSGLPSMLGRVSAGDISLAATPPRAVLDRLLAASAKRHRRSRLLLSLAASIVVVAVGGSVLTATLNTPQETSAAGAAPAMASPDSAQKRSQAEAGTLMDAQGEMTQSQVAPEDPARSSFAPTSTAPPEIMSEPAQETFTFSGRAGDVRLALGLIAEEGGTRVDIKVSGIPVGTACRLVAVDLNGTVSPVSSWTVKRGDYKGGRAHLPPGSSEYTIGQIDRFELITSSGRPLVTVSIRQPTPGS